MNINSDQLMTKLHADLDTFYLSVEDESDQHAGHAGSDGSGQGTHFRVRIGSLAFTGLSRVERHRLVYDALKPFIDQGLHALAIEIVEPPL
ncbi:MAG: BolA family protein [Limnohabitans sp.]